MADYKSTHTGAEIDAGIDKAVTAESNWSLLMANLGVGRWANQKFITLWDTPTNFYDNLSTQYTSLIRMFQNTDFSVYDNCIMPDFRNQATDAIYFMHSAKGKKITFGNGFIGGDAMFMNSTFTEILVADNKTFYIGGGYNCVRSFAQCSNLTTIGAFDMSKIHNSYALFQWILGSTKIAHIHCKHFKYSFDISPSTAFEESDLVEIISNLDTVTTAQTLTMGTTNLAKLTDDEKKVATDKGWVLA